MRGPVAGVRLAAVPVLVMAGLGDRAARQALVPLEIHAAHGSRPRSSPAGEAGPYTQRAQRMVQARADREAAGGAEPTDGQAAGS